METRERAVRPFYLMVQGKEFELGDLVKGIKKKLADRTIAKEEIKQLDDLKKAFESYKVKQSKFK